MVLMSQTISPIKISYPCFCTFRRIPKCFEQTENFSAQNHLSSFPAEYWRVENRCRESLRKSTNSKCSGSSRTRPCTTETAFATCSGWSTLSVESLTTFRLKTFCLTTFCLMTFCLTTFCLTTFRGRTFWLEKLVFFVSWKLFCDKKNCKMRLEFVNERMLLFNKNSQIYFYLEVLLNFISWKLLLIRF